MKYMIMECHPGYAVALDDQGNFLKVANRQYEPGQYVDQVIPLREPTRTVGRKWLYSLSAIAACLVLLMTLFLPATPKVYGSVYIAINPEVRIDVDRRDRVIGLVGINQDGTDLIEGYDYYKKDLALVTDELVDRAMEMGYLQDAGQITIQLDSKDSAWVDSRSAHLCGQLQRRLRGSLSVDVQVETHGGHHSGSVQDPTEAAGGHHGQSENTGHHHNGLQNGEGNRYGAEENTEATGTPEESSHHGASDGHSGGGHHHSDSH